jgi:putative transposase
MPRAPRITVPGIPYHVLNRANGGMPLFQNAGDFQAFERILSAARERTPMRILAYCLMPNHWHLVLWPGPGADLSSFVGWLTLTHTQRWHAAHGTTGTGHVYQGRFKSLPVESDGHLIAVCRYVERNPLRAGLVDRAEKWRWGSLWRRLREGEGAAVLLSPWPLERPSDWIERVNQPQSEAELSDLRRAIARGRPYGGQRWIAYASTHLGLGQTLRPRGRPRRA